MKKFAKPVIGLLALLMILGVGSTLAFLIDSDEPVENIFTPSRVTSEVVEDTFNGITKTNVKVKNTGDTDAYIRAAIVVTWKDAEDGNVLGQEPVLYTDYVWTLNEVDWKKEGNYYYYQGVVAPNGETEYLITGCKLAEDATAPVGYGLNVEIICSAIQAGPEGAVNAWKGVNKDE